MDETSIRTLFRDLDVELAPDPSLAARLRRRHDRRRVAVPLGVAALGVVSAAVAVPLASRGGGSQPSTLAGETATATPLTPARTALGIDDAYALPADDLLREFSLPVDAYDDSVPSARAADYYRVLNRCFAAKGVPPQAVEVTFDPSQPYGGSSAREYGGVYGATSVSFAQPHGYLRTLGQEFASTGAPASVVQARTATGCFQQLDQQLNPRQWPAHAVDAFPADNVLLGSYSEAQKDPRVVAANAAWKTCMRAQGYDYDSFESAVMAYWGEKTPSAEAKATAVADVTCKDRTGLLRTYAQVEGELQRAAIAARPTYFADEKAALRAWEANRDEVLDGD